MARSYHDTGFLVGGVLGVAVRSWLNVRFEADLSYRRHQLDDLRLRRDGGLGESLGVAPLDGLSASELGLEVGGRTNVFAALANYWVDIPTGTPFTPYLGGGLGLARVTVRSIQLEGMELADDHDTVFAWQLGAGFDFALTPNWSLNAGYRWFNTSDAELEFTPTGETVSYPVRSHSILGGIRFTF